MQTRGKVTTADPLGIGGYCLSSTRSDGSTTETTACVNRHIRWPADQSLHQLRGLMLPVGCQSAAATVLSGRLEPGSRTVREGVVVRPSSRSTYSHTAPRQAPIALERLFRHHTPLPGPYRSIRRPGQSGQSEDTRGNSCHDSPANRRSLHHTLHSIDEKIMMA